MFLLAVMPGFWLLLLLRKFSSNSVDTKMFETFTNYSILSIRIRYFSLTQLLTLDHWLLINVHDFHTNYVAFDSMIHNLMNHRSLASVYLFIVLVFVIN